MESADIVESWRDKNESTFTSIASRITPFQVFIFGIVFIFVIYLTNNNSVNSSQYNYIIYGAFILTIIILIMRRAGNKEIIPEFVVKQIAQECLEKKRREGNEISFDSKVFVTPACHLKYESDMVSGTSGPVSWEVGAVEKVHGTEHKKEWVISIHPFKGTITGFREMPLGYTGNETKDVTIVPVGIVQGNAKTTDFGKPSKP